VVKLQIIAREKAKVAWIATEDELDAALVVWTAAAQSDGRLHLVQLNTKSSTSLSVALGGSETVLIFGSRGRKPPYCHSRGEGKAIEPVLVCHAMGQHEMEIPRRLVIPMARGLAAVKEFAATGERPTSIQWEEMID
jgi:hypothetical protein